MHGVGARPRVWSLLCSEIVLLEVSKQRKRRQQELGIHSDQNVLANALMAGEEAGVPDSSLMPSAGQDACGCPFSCPLVLTPTEHCTCVSPIWFHDYHILSLLTIQHHAMTFCLLSEPFPNTVAWLGNDVMFLMNI